VTALQITGFSYWRLYKMKNKFQVYNNIDIENIIRVKIFIMDESINIPLYKSYGASGFDIESSEDVIINPGETKLIGTGLKMEISKGYELQIRPRSGISFKTKLRIANSPGSIDNDYRGEIKIIMDNIGKEIEYIKKGERIAQGVFAPFKQAMFNLVKNENELEKTKRGKNGFGSTGR
jgi:dUTP pyrophosphatase